jgi:hypothetical protein
MEKIKWSTIVMVIAILYGIGFMVAIFYGNPFGDVIFMVGILIILLSIGVYGWYSH